MDLTDLRKGNRIELSGGRKGTVLEVFPTRGKSPTGKMRKPRVVVNLDSKPSMAIKVCAAQVIGLA